MRSSGCLPIGCTFGILYQTKLELICTAVQHSKALFGALTYIEEC